MLRYGPRNKTKDLVEKGIRIPKRLKNIVKITRGKERDLTLIIGCVKTKYINTK